jgi:uncharacterized protein (DUF302 family)
MTNCDAVTTFAFSENFDDSLRLIRKILSEEGLQIPTEPKVSEMIRKEFGIGLKACRVMCVSCPLFLLEAIALDRSAAVFLPLHLVVCGHEGRTEVHVLSLAGLSDCSMAIGAKLPISKTLSRLTRCLEKIGSRTDPLLLQAPES